MGATPDHPTLASASFASARVDLANSWGDDDGFVVSADSGLSVVIVVVGDAVSVVSSAKKGVPDLSSSDAKSVILLLVDVRAVVDVIDDGMVKARHCALISSNAAIMVALFLDGGAIVLVRLTILVDIASPLSDGSWDVRPKSHRHPLTLDSS